MTDTPDPNEALALDEHIANDWFIVNVVTETHFATVGLKTNKRTSVLQAINAHADAVGILKKNAPFGQPPRIVPLESVESIEWHADDAELTVRYFDENKQKSRRARASFSSSDARQQIVEAIKKIVGECEYREEPTSIWHIGIPQLIFSAIALFFCGALAIAGYLKEGPVDVDNMRGRGRGLAALLNAVGPNGMVFIGVAIISAMMIWWFIACLNPPVKSIATPVRNTI